MYSPVDIKPSKYFGNNWFGDSPKMNRQVYLHSDLEYDHWVLVETNPNIVAFCEQPLRIQSIVNEDLIESVFDMWVQYKDSEEHFIEVKYSHELNPNNPSPKSQRAIRQTTAQMLWCKQHGFQYSIMTEDSIRGNPIYLSNMKEIIPCVRMMKATIETDEYLLLRVLKGKNRMTFSELFHLLHTKITAQRLRNIIYWCIYHGKILSNADQIPFSPQTEVWTDV
ncbi:TnsA endonuclease N-terminal domain-containing protein [Ammoniphilus resinae]|uniref:TnsA endonuclease N-terminal domain-containing protein n=1 Tax=Ammoniphilus resinae TaxID=861532 RepID=A0ABS4GPK2_9BACL|nr:TnsA endonuclease N-terminal domain-containing protein [Ammoniphilus resinae]MBP1931987.1 hypothetical protein [Ammoniphilus resinae]